MSKKNLFIEVRSITRSARADIMLHTTKIHELEDKLNSPKYSKEYKDTTIRPQIAKLKQEREAFRENATKKAGDLAREYMTKQAALDDLRGEQVTDDARLLNCGVKLTAQELETMFDRNAGNGTMQQLICRYAQENGMNREFRRAYHNHSADCVNLDHDVAHMTDVALKYYNQNSAYDQIAGEGGMFDQQIDSAE